MAESSHREHDQTRIQLKEPLDRKAEAIKYAGTKVLDQHIGATDKLGQCRLPGRRLEVDRYGFLIAVGRQEVGGLALPSVGVEKRRAPAHVIIAAGWLLHLDNSRAQIAEHHRGMGPRQRPRQIEYEQAVES